jgi:MFS family permease
VGAALCAFILTQRPVRRHAGYQMLVNVAIFGAATIVFGVSTHFWLTMAVLAVMGAADMISVFIRQSIIQLSTPDAMRGRVNAVNSIFVGASNELGEFESGVTAEWWGTVPAVVVGGIGTIVIALLWMRVFPDLRRIDRMDPASLARAAENVAGR